MYLRMIVAVMLFVQGPEYKRRDWGRWIDEDGDCQNTRAEVLQRDSQGAVQWRGNRECRVDWGAWVCPYTGRVLLSARDVDVDHVVPLKWAHKHGGAFWTKEQKRSFTNDMLNLLTVDDDINKEKGSKGPDEWMPPLKSFHDDYIKIWDAVLEKYDLTRN